MLEILNSKETLPRTLIERVICFDRMKINVENSLAEHQERQIANELVETISNANQFEQSNFQDAINRSLGIIKEALENLKARSQSSKKN